MKTSNLYSIDYRDLLKAFLIAVISPVAPIIMDTINNGSLTFDWKQIGITAGGAAFAYILKNFFTTATIKTVADSPTLVAKVEQADPSTKSPVQ